MVRISTRLLKLAMLAMLAWLAWMICVQAASQIATAVAGAGLHADMRHGAEAQIARQCADRPELRFVNPYNNRTALVCLTKAERYGVVIINERGEEITAFLKNKLERVEQVIRYMRNRGYQPVQ